MSQLKILIAETDSNTIKTLKQVLAKKPSRMVGSGGRPLQEVASPSSPALILLKESLSD